jgi:hypothetical protein
MLHRLGPRALAALALFASLAAQAAPGATLRPYREEGELAAALERWRSGARQVAMESRRMSSASGLAMNAVPAPAAAPPAQEAAADRAAPAEAAAAAGDSITNVQTAGVDEGGIVKRAGEHLIVLRRGRLFTLRVGGDQLQPVAMADAYAPGSDPRGAWYDELLVSGRQVVVIGYSYERGGTEIGLFELAGDGRLAWRATYHLRSFDYYASRNYASRLIGRQLVFYSPTLLQPWGDAPQQMMPALRRWRAELPGQFQRILPATRIYRSDDDFDPRQPLALHTVTRCELGEATLQCEASAVLGPVGRVFYVSQGSVYVWAGGGRRGGGHDAVVFRLPLQDGLAPSGLKTVGMPVDQMSFLEDGQGFLNVLLREQGRGENMFDGERGRGAMALLRVPLAAFGDGRTAARREHYRRLPGAAAQNRFVGDWLLWGGDEGAWALRYAASGEAQALSPGHAVERIEALGDQALLVGNAGSELQFSALALNRGAARIAGRHSLPGAQQGETRSHGFFYRATAADEGLLGLPIVEPEQGRRPAVHSGAQGAAAVVFLRQRQLQFSALGQLGAQPGRVGDDGCKASCVDWYGNARPIFIGERVFALLGYELVEGRLEGRGRGERIEERRRVSFAPQARGRRERPTPFE